MRTAAERPPSEQVDAAGFAVRLVDILAVAALVVAAFVARRHVFPGDGLWGDDAWAAFGAINGSFDELHTVGFAHPGFTAALMAWNSLVSAPERMVDLVFVAGVVSPALLYVALRRFGYVASISFLLAAALVAVDFHVVYSGRVKTYVIDALIVLALATAVPRLARLRWRLTTAALWIVGSLVLGAFSPFALVASAVAGLFLVLRASRDRAVRLVAVAVQTAGYLALTFAVQRTHDVDRIEGSWDEKYDGFIVGWNPIELASQTATHTSRAAEVFTGGPRWWAALCLIAAGGALIADAAVRRRTGRVLRAQYLLLLLLVAAAAAFVNVLPFGARSDGMRLSIWLIPIFAIGLASVLRRFRHALGAVPMLPMGFDVVAIIVGVVLILSASNGGPSYPLTGSRSATEFIETQLDENDLVLVDHLSGMYPYAVASRLDVVVEARPSSKIGFQPKFRDRRVHFLGYTGERGDELQLTSSADRGRDLEVEGLVDTADRVFVYMAAPRRIPDQGHQAIAGVLRRSGLELERTETFGTATVSVWRQPAT